jgi:hypothetical protein
MLLFLMPCISLAQPGVEIRLLRNLDAYERFMYMALTCNGDQVYQIDPTDIKLFQDSTPIWNFTIQRYPSMTRKSEYNAALVYDRTSDVLGSTFTSMVVAGKNFVAGLGTSQATIVSYGTAVDILEFLTDDSLSLSSALTSMSLPAGTRIRSIVDGINAGITEMEAHGTSSIRSVIAMTTGWDEISDSQISKLVKEANASNYRIFIISIGQLTNVKQLKSIAAGSGGKFISVGDPDSLSTVFIGLQKYIQREYDEFWISFTSPTPLSLCHVLEASVNLCDDTAFATWNFDTVVQYTEAAPSVTTGYSLDQCYPHPISRTTQATINLTVPPGGDKHAVLSIVDMLGRTIRTIYDGPMKYGKNEIQFSVSELPSGMYLFRFQSEKNTITRRFIIAD